MPAYTIGKQKRNSINNLIQLNKLLMVQGSEHISKMHFIISIKGYSGSRIKTSPSVSFNKAQRDNFK